MDGRGSTELSASDLHPATFPRTTALPRHKRGLLRRYIAINHSSHFSWPPHIALTPNSVQLVVTLMIGLETQRWTVFSHAFIWGSLIAWWVFCLYMFQMPMMIWGWEDFYGMAFRGRAPDAVVVRANREEVDPYAGSSAYDAREQRESVLRRCPEYRAWERFWAHLAVLTNPAAVVLVWLWCLPIPPSLGVQASCSISSRPRASGGTGSWPPPRASCQTWPGRYVSALTRLYMIMNNAAASLSASRGAAGSLGVRGFLVYDSRFLKSHHDTTRKRSSSHLRALLLP